ncbi:type VI secretion system membrane subunit TssM [Ralstonia pickettii]|uniref:type VI secretion system membrane subunit TssM n=1 Tax=Ralstonia pickettii TaxID=329 RepID=UPI000BDBA105|nr:type VI secretion system membrane subunit TssM [Ralstonia pickettii]POH89032.1 type VI secretion system membrane subunit TssM [Ralstonia pickettii]
MEFLKRLRNALFSWQMLLLLAILLVAAAVWWIGPLLSFDGIVPLAGVGVRVAVIALLLALYVFVVWGWPVFFLAATALCLLIWHAGPLLALNAHRPLQDTTPRLLLIAVIVLVSVVYLFALLWRSIRSGGVVRKWLDAKTDDEEEVAPESDVKAVTSSVDAAMRQLKALRTRSGLGRLFEGRRYLYELPWFLTLGIASTGKTSVLSNAGLRFPLASGAGSPGRAEEDRKAPVWRFSNEAVLIDPVGNYTSQDRKPAAVKAEWSRFLDLLRKYRGRAPINGAVVTVSVADLVRQTAQERADEALKIRHRLIELRQELGIQFPIYVVVTKLDLLPGFAQYFQYLGSEGRAQSWGFGLPAAHRPKRGETAHAIGALCRTEMAALEARLIAGETDRFNEEFDAGRKKALLGLAEEFDALTNPLADLVDQIFENSRYDNTQHNAMLRGVHFTSAAQTGASVNAADDTVTLQVLDAKALDEEQDANATTSSGSYFLQDLFKRGVFPEAHLVRPNLRWEFRFRLMRLLAHALVLMIFLWLVAGFYLSFGHNTHYLDVVKEKTHALAARVTAFYKKPEPEGTPVLLAEANDLAAFPGLVLSEPPLHWRYGLYVAPQVLAAAMGTHVKLEDNLLVPYLVRRVETVLSAAIADKDAKLTYDTLRVYLMLYDKDSFNALDVRGWVQSDWATGGGADAFGGRIAAVEHLNSLLDGTRPIHSPYAKNEDLIRSARDFLDGNTSTERLYDRAKAAMMEGAPADFTLVRAIGPQAGTVFSRASGEPLERGIPGLFTYAGYHKVFNTRLPEFVNKAQAIDAWVMGRPGAQKKTLESAAGRLTGDDPVSREIRRLYLTEYAQRWSEFLSDIRALTGNNLAFDLEVLRNFAAPDSPLARLGRVVVRETTLSQPTEPEDKSLADKALAVLDSKSDKISGFAARAEARQERELVDNRFAALREVVTGQADVAAPNAQTKGDQPRLDAIAGMVNAYYTSLMVASNALETRNLPPSAEAGAQLKMEAAKLPAPLKEVLADLVVQGTRDVNKGIGDILIAQMNAVIGESCRSAIDGKYPFTPTSAQDVDTEDFARVFATGGVLDDFFQKVLAPHVDTTISPWRYKLSAPDVPPVAGPSLIPFQRAKEIREVFFRDPGAKKMAWKVDLKVVELDPEIVELNMDFDGQGLRYVHGPVIPLKVTWPGPRGGQGAEITANPRVRPETSTLTANGPWAMMRVIAKGKLASSVSNSHFIAEYDFDGRKAKLDINTGSLANPWTTGLLQGFQCPGRSG